MRQLTLLELLVVIFAVFLTDPTLATNTKEKTADNFNVLDVNRNLKAVSEVIKPEDGPTDPETEERGGFKLPSFNGIKNFFTRSSSVSKAVKPNPDIATTLNNPQVRQVFNDVGKQPGFFQSIKNNPIQNTLASRLRGRSTTFTSRQVTGVGHLAVTSSSSSTLAKMWVKWGALFLFVVGILFLFTVVSKGLQPN
ncbi:Secreted RxLR effector peptide protein [Phytophthora palmivora]|uniref:Secreted RxLR effector peptide protein n=1 Tax=Phytophthora palmivora TaxID=4796 RepID=A0A2P4WVK7_9STRA|nr:Secreted RxLR effector peptide protein [Phytophthora palmivora]